VTHVAPPAPLARYFSTPRSPTQTHEGMVPPQQPCALAFASPTPVAPARPSSALRKAVTARRPRAAAFVVASSVPLLAKPKRNGEKSGAGVPKVFFMLGNAGTGKGTQCARLVKRFGLDHVSAGDLLRAEAASGSARGNRIAEILREGSIVPSEITMELLKKVVCAGSTAPGILVDGFPRKLDQAAQFVDEVCAFEFAVWLDCDEDVLLRRLKGRGARSGRSDDNIESIVKRFRTFDETCRPVIDLYMSEGKAVRVDAAQTEEEVFADLVPLFEDALHAPSAVVAVSEM
jgi:UMP-CMP kinase